MKCVPLDNAAQLEELAAAPGPRLLLKHNTTCPISRGVLERLQLPDNEIDGVDALYVLDLMQHRDISDAVADRFGVEHASPQLLLLKNGSCTYHQSGFAISTDEVADAL
ncbi:MAG: bacillithiol system redox-active protein YtxJ [Chitinophagaceae bacterium]|nr:MAG: bacillithiol system redox-active protein YtxJ [Chitinophagaceae bacterium]